MPDTSLPPTIHATAIRYIKLGEGGCWEQECFERGILRLGFESPLHTQSLAGDWDQVYNYWANFRKIQNPNNSDPYRTATDDIRQIQTFYEAPPSLLFFTLHGRRLYWCFAETDVIEETPSGTRIRHTVDGWHCTDINGKPLHIETIDGRVTSTAGYRGTICELNKDVREYLINKINGRVNKEVEKAIEDFNALKLSVEKLVRGLHWKDFELLVDLVLTNAGLRRISSVGGTTKNIDIDMLMPVSNRRVFVQVKSFASQSILDKCIEDFSATQDYDEFYFFFHSGSANVVEDDEGRRINVIGPDRISELVIEAGLTNWLILRRS